MFQDNQSAILLENNRKKSRSKRTKHINIRYYFITDRIKNDELQIEYCPTDNMVADYFTKPLQGKNVLPVPQHYHEPQILKKSTQS